MPVTIKFYSFVGPEASSFCNGEGGAMRVSFEYFDGLNTWYSDNISIKPPRNYTNPLFYSFPSSDDNKEKQYIKIKTYSRYIGTSIEGFGEQTLLVSHIGPIEIVHYYNGRDEILEGPSYAEIAGINT